MNMICVTMSQGMIAAAASRSTWRCKTRYSQPTAKIVGVITPRWSNSAMIAVRGNSTKCKGKKTL